KENRPTTEVILITGYPSIKTVIEAMRLGSYDYLIKPFENVDLISVVEQCFERQQALQEPTKLRGLDALYEVSKAMSTIMDLDNLLNLIMKLACETLEADGGSVMILESGTDLVVKSAAGTFKDVVIGKRLKIGERVAGKAAELCQPILITGDIEKDKRFEGIKKFEEIKSGMSVPLLVRDKLIGVINLKRVNNEEKYTEDDLKLLTVFAADAAIAIENAKIYQELLKHTSELERLVQASKELTK
ncbi:MAG: GAF domain-containing protein, partial [Elusimicrobiota bacterium]|nr:GAF domain-containing protein [Elusimicrobiota bacterium]